MRTVQLLKSWNGHKKNDVVTIDNNVAFGLIDSKIATYKIRKIQEKTVKRVIESDDKMTKEMRVDKSKSSSYKIK